jgi:hypothetical protein
MGWVVNAMPRTLNPREDPVPIVQEAGWASEPVWTGAENTPPGFDPRTVQPVASRCTYCGSPCYTYSTVPILLRVVT